MYDSATSKMTPMRKPDISTKILLLGDHAVGKTSLLQEFCGPEAGNPAPTIGIDLCNIDIIIDDLPIKAKIWDTAGQEKYMMLNRNFYRDTQGALLVFDLTRGIDRENIEKWFRELKEESKIDACIVLVGNKCDLNMNPETSAYLKEYSKDHNLQYFECSAKKGINVEEAFETLFREVKKRHLDSKTFFETSSYSFKLSVWKEPKKSCSC